MQKTKIKYCGKDSFFREVFVTEDGVYVVDINYDPNNRSFYSKANNDFDGDPKYKLKTEMYEVVDDF